MVINYSKWDALELSDDSDIEVHPNVDKKSFIRAKQAQIHQNRDHRRHQIKTLQYERIINDGLTERVERLVASLKAHAEQTKEKHGGKRSGGAQEVDKLVFQSLMESISDFEEDRPPPPPAGVHDHITDKPTYSQMMAALVDQVKKDVNEAKEQKTSDKGDGQEDDRLRQYITGIEAHGKRVAGLQKELFEKLAELENEEKRHITSDDIHTGFDYSKVQKGQDATKSQSSKQSSTAVTSPELINSPKDPQLQHASEGQSSAQGIEEDEEEASMLAKGFAKIPTSEYSRQLQFIREHPQILAPKETDGLLLEAFNNELKGKGKLARTCVHHGLLVQYCRQLGGLSAVDLFFKRIMSRDHSAAKMFHDDVANTYSRVETRAKEMNLERERERAAAGEEQIQLQAVNPDTQLTITIPPPLDELPDVSKLDTDVESSAADEDDATRDARRKLEEAAAIRYAREVFDSFSPPLQRALETSSLDAINKVLAKMRVDEAEDVVAKLSDSGMLNLQNTVIDATTEEGQETVKEIEKTRRLPSDAQHTGGGDAAHASEEAAQPGPGPE